MIMQGVSEVNDRGSGVRFTNFRDEGVAYESIQVSEILLRVVTVQYRFENRV